MFRQCHQSLKDTGETAEAVTSVGFDQIDTCRVVGALMVDAVVDVGFTAVALVAGGAVATGKVDQTMLVGIIDSTAVIDVL